MNFQKETDLKRLDIAQIMKILENHEPRSR